MIDQGKTRMTKELSSSANCAFIDLESSHLGRKTSRENGMAT